MRAAETRRLVLFGLFLLPASTGGSQQLARDFAPPVSSAAIAGVVLSDEPAARPVRRALVTLANNRGGASVAAVTDDNGAFAIPGLAAGRYTVTASKPGFVNAAYGAVRPGRQGTPIELGDGQRLSNLTIRIARGAVVTGTVLDQSGEPLPAANVGLMRYVYSSQNGERTLQPAGQSATTDDRGVYRMYGIPPGDYLIELNAPFSLPGDLRQTTEQSMQTALQLLRSAGADASARRTPAAPAPTVGYAPIFYPGTTSPATATTVALVKGEERSGVDIPFQLVPTARVDGIVVGPDGLPASNVQLSLLGAGQSNTSMSISNLLSTMFGGGRPKGDGSFSLSGLAPGQYTIAARTAAAGRPGEAASTSTVLWATAEVSVDGRDVSGVRLTLEPGMSVTGRMVFEGTTPPPQDFSGVRVTLSPVLSGASVAAVSPPAQANAQGQFSFTGVTPGRYHVSAIVGTAARGTSAGPGGATFGSAARGPAFAPAQPWTLKSATAKGRETLDSTLEIIPNEDVNDLVLTFFDRATELVGTLQDASGRPASDYFIILYASDKAYWSAPSRRIAQTRPANNGTFAIRNLPAGDYLVAAVTDVEPGEWMDPALLAQLVPASIRVVLIEGQTRTQDIRIAGGT